MQGQHERTVDMLEDKLARQASAEELLWFLYDCQTDNAQLKALAQTAAARRQRLQRPPGHTQAAPGDQKPALDRLTTPAEAFEQGRKVQQQVWEDISGRCGGHRGEYDHRCRACGYVTWFAGYTDPNKEGISCPECSR